MWVEFSFHLLSPIRYLRRDGERNLLFNLHPPIWYCWREGEGIPHPFSFPPSDTRIDMWGECLHPPYFPPSDTIVEIWGIHPINFPHIILTERDVEGISPSTFFPIILYWWRDVEGNRSINLLFSYLILTERCRGNPSIPLICYLLILTERCGGNPPIRFIAPSDCPGKLWEEGGCPHQPPFSYLILTRI